MHIAEFYRFLAHFVLARKKRERPIIVGVNGIDGSGKTILVGNLALMLEQTDRSKGNFNY